MRRVLWATLWIWPLLLAGCPHPEAVEDPKSLAEVYFHHININQGVDYILRISPAGDLAFQLRLGDGKLQRATGRLTPDQITALYNAFKGWGRLDSSYPGDWTNTILLTYNGYTVEVHDELQAPRQFVAIEELLRTYLDQALQASTRSAASQPGTETAPASAPQP